MSSLQILHGRMPLVYGKRFANFSLVLRRLQSDLIFVYRVISSLIDVNIEVYLQILNSNTTSVIYLL